MKLLPEDLDTYIRNYQRYLGAIKRLDLEIEAKEAEITRLPGSIIKKPDGTNKAPKTTTRQVQLLLELDQLMQDRELYQNRIELVDDLIKQSRELGQAWLIIKRRASGVPFHRMEDELYDDRRNLRRKYWQALESYLGS